MDEEVRRLESKIRDKEWKGKNAEKYKTQLVSQKKAQESYLKQQIVDANLKKQKEIRDQETRKVLEKIEKVGERLNNIESSNYLIDKRAREDEKKQKLREAFE